MLSVAAELDHLLDIVDGPDKRDYALMERVKLDQDVIPIGESMRPYGTRNLPDGTVYTDGHIRSTQDFGLVELFG